jgi:hypothetical protein
MSTPDPLATRFLFPEDRLTFVYGRPGDPIRTPPRTAIKLFFDEDATTPADVLTTNGQPIPFSTIYTGEDSLLPEFYGPAGWVPRLWARVTGGTAETYPLVAQYSERLANLPMLLSGLGPPADDVGAVGSFYIDRNPADPDDPQSFDDPLLYGPRGPGGWPITGVSLRGPQGDPGARDEWLQQSPAMEWQIPHTLGHRPAVTTIDSAGELMFGDVIYPPGQPELVIVRFGAPESGTAVLT